VPDSRLNDYTRTRIHPAVFYDATNAQGEAIFNLTSEAIARVIVPFVPGWSARVRAGEVNDDIVLGLPAVRLPVFLPVQNRPAGEG